MKLITTTIILAFFSNLILAQTAAIQSIDSGGESTTSTIKAVYTIGETVVTEFSDTNFKVSEGFINDITVEGTLSLGESTPEIAIKPYPNPTQNYIHLDYPLATTVNYVVVNSLGEIVLSLQLNGDKHQLNIDQFSQGIYFIKAINNKKELGTFKIIKQ